MEKDVWVEYYVNRALLIFESESRLPRHHIRRPSWTVQIQRGWKEGKSLRGTPFAVSLQFVVSERNGFMEFSSNGDPLPAIRMECYHMLGARLISADRSEFLAKKVRNQVLFIFDSGASVGIAVVRMFGGEIIEDWCLDSGLVVL